MLTMTIAEKVRQAAKTINAADALLVTAGAGTGVDSGLPDFRGTQGFWRAYPVIAKLGLSFEEVANPAWFKDDPALAWAFYGHGLNLYRTTVPHAGFSRLLEIGRSKPHGYFGVGLLPNYWPRSVALGGGSRFRRPQTPVGSVPPIRLASPR